MCGSFSCDKLVAGGNMKRSKRINRNLSVIGIMILAFLLFVFGNDVINFGKP